MMAFIADTTTATRISHARRLPVHRVNASIPWLSFRSDCNDKSSPFAPLPSWPRRSGAAAYSAVLASSRRTKPAGSVAVNWKFVDIEGELAPGIARCTEISPPAQAWGEAPGVFLPSRRPRPTGRLDGRAVTG